MKRQKREKKRDRASAIRKDAAGRVHLVLQRNPKDGSTQVGLRAPLFGEPWQNELASSAANTVHAALQGGVKADAVVAITEQLMAATSRLADGLLARAANGTVACKAGCAHCCYQSVGVTPAEALAIATHLRVQRTEQELRDVEAKLRQARERTRGLSAQERFSPEHPCPFLSDARCTIYEVRPLSCRGMNSLDATECSDNLHDPEARARFLASGVGGRSFLEPIRTFHAISAGLQLSLSEMFHLDMRPRDLTAAVLEILEQPEEVTRAWLTGRPALESALGGDSTADARSKELSGALPRR